MSSSSVRSRRGLRAALTAIVALAALVVPTVAPASADVEVGDTVYIRDKVGYGGTGTFRIYENAPPLAVPGPGYDWSGVGAPDYYAYCLENRVSARVNTSGVVGELGSFLGSNYFTDPAVQGKVLWVLAHSFPALSLEDFGIAAGVPGISHNDAAEATQYAIWRYTDLGFDANWAWETPDSEAAYRYLVNGANASSGMTPGDFEVSVGVTAPPSAAAESLVGPFTISTNQPTAQVAATPGLPITDSTGTPINAAAVVDGQQVYLDLRAVSTSGSATVTVSAAGSSATGKVISVPTSNGGTPTAASHAQSIILVTPDTTRTSDEVAVSWAGTAIPEIGTTLVDQLDGDKYVAQSGGTVVDTVAYSGLEPSTQYVVSGELYDQATGAATGITGSTTFTSTATGEGTVDVTFTVNGNWAGRTLVAFETLTLGGTEVASHEDIDDVAQTVYVSDIGTTLVDAADGDKNVTYSGGTVVDTVEYTNLAPNTVHTVEGELYDKADGSATGITGTTTFTSSATGSGTVDVEFVIPEGYAGTTLVAFEVVTQNASTGPVEVAVHEDINDAAQTVTVEDAPVPAIGTTLLDAADGDNVISWLGGDVVDTVTFTNLIPGVEYTLSGELMRKSDGSPTGITGTTIFTPTSPGGTVTVTFTVPFGYAGEQLVAFEYLTTSAGGVTTEVAEHADIDDAAQTVTVEEAPVPAIGTTLVDALDGDKYVAQVGGTVVDTVAYENLIPNTEYTVSGELMEQETGLATGITGSATFTSSNTGTGTVEVEFEITAEWAGKALTAFEVVSLGDVEVAWHEDITDEAQTVYVSDIGTTLVDAADGDKNVASAGGTVIDAVAYTNLAPSTEYTVRGELYDKGTGAATGITGSATFTSSATGSGTVEVEFVINDQWAGHTLVAFEVVTQSAVEGDDVIVATHEDIDDAAQTVTVGDVPLIGTTLVDALDGDKYVAQAGGTVVDTVAYENLEPNTQYTVSGELMDRATGAATGITGSSTFTSSETGTGTATVEFVITAEWAGKALTAFEVVSLGDVEVAWHEDITDEAQTVYVSDIGTTLVDAVDGDKSIAAAGGVVVDKVAYTNLAPNTVYTVSGELMDKATGKGTGIKASATFTSSATGNGVVEVTFVINERWAGATLVAFEVVTQATASGTVTVAVHQDINDAAQTVTVQKKGGALPSTGVSGGTLPLAVGGAAALLAGAFLVATQRKRSRRAS